MMMMMWRKEFYLDEQDELLLTPEGHVRGSSVQGLVRALVGLQGGKDVYESYIQSFFLTYRVFITPMDLQLSNKRKICFVSFLYVQKKRFSLQELYCNTSLFPELEPPVVWSRVLGVLRHWITEHAEDFAAKGMQALLWSFLEEVSFFLLGFLFFIFFADCLRDSFSCNR